MTRSMAHNGRDHAPGSYTKKHQPARNIRASIEFARPLSFDYGDKAGKATCRDTPDGRDPAAQRLSILSMQSTKIEKRWNVFRSIPRDQEAFEPRWTLLSAQILKLIAYLILHVIVLGSGVAAKTSLFLMVASVQSADRTFVPCRPYGHRKALIPQDREQHPANSVAWFYWYLWIAMCVPQILLLIRSIRVVIFKFVPSPTIHLFFLAFFLETAQTVGVCLLIFAVLPGLDSVRASMLLSALAIVPAMLRSLRHFQSGVLNNPKRVTRLVADLLILLCQSSALWIWPIFDPFHRSEFGSRILLPISLLLSSLTFWENYVDRADGPRVMVRLARLRDRLQRVRYKTQIALTFWKCLLSLFFMIVCGGARHSVGVLFDLTSPFSKWLNSTVEEEIPLEIREQHQFSYNVWLLFLTLVFSTFLCYQCARFACKVRMDRFSYAIPTVAILPMSTILLLSFCEARRYQACYFASWIPERFFWRCDYGNLANGLFERRSAWAWVFWFVSYVGLIGHVFRDSTGRLNKTDTIFINPLYDGMLVDHTLTLNRRRRKSKLIRSKDLEDDLNEESGATDGTETSLAYSLTSMSLLNSHADTMTKIYICATMWHETREEMVQTLKSIIRMDEDQSARKNAQKYLKVVDKDYYELEAHIFFDDAWTDSPELGCRVPNEFVEMFVGSVDEAASAVHKVHMKLLAPVKLDVPYGGRLVWTLPGDNRLFVHLKDKQKIRNKKRWSQVMYMYYLLGHRVMEMISDVHRKQLLADNTFILTIDGDSKFTPSAVQKLVDLMKKHSRLGSACGRIHPIGSGIMVWYQKFEYAIAHWFQKAAEHVFGCVLCSPGCFSMFRGSALMDDNVMNKYTKLAEDARHFVQYDQGEDRWLSTLLLKQGYRIEYAAAADAETHAPEGFNEFFNQRRRWTPSSTANTLDLLYDFQRAVRNNDSLSRFYIFYQMLVILFSLLSPAIIFTMMVFAQIATLPLSHSLVMWFNVTPVATYCLTCFIASSNTQLLFAKLLSIMYAFVMMAVLVGTGIQITTEGASSPISIFVMSLASIFFVAAFFHPHEFTNIFYGTVFFLMIPCTYVLLSLYALVNLNVINWGTREAAERAAGRASETKWQQWLRKLRPGGKKARSDREASRMKESKVECGCPDLCMCFLCPEHHRGGSGMERRQRAEGNEEERFIWLGEHLERFDRRMDRMETRLEDSARRRSLILPSSLVLSTTAGLDNRSVDDGRSTGLSHAYSAPLPLLAGSGLMPRLVENEGSPRADEEGQVQASASSMVPFADESANQSHSAMDTENQSWRRRCTSLPEIRLISPTPMSGGAPRQRVLSEMVDDSAQSFHQRSTEESSLPEEMPSLDAEKYHQRTLHRYRGRTLIHARATSMDADVDSSVDSSVLNQSIEDAAAREEGNDAGHALVEVADGTGEPYDHSTPKWMNLPYINHGSNDILDETENQFWNDLIETYLKPVEKNPKDEARIADQLRGLRNKVAFGLLLINALLILIIYLLQMHKELLSIDWNPMGNYTIIKWDPQTGKYQKFVGPLKIEPVGFMIILFLSLILVVQTMGMIAHRWQTLQHTLASTVLPCFKRMRLRERSGEELLEENAVEIAKRLQRLGEEENSDDKRRGKGKRAAGGGDPAANAVQRRRRVVFNLERARKYKPKTRGLHATFQKRFFNFNPDKHRESFRGIRLEKDNVLFQSDSAKKATARALKKRRDSVIEANVHRSGSFVREDDVADFLTSGSGSGRHRAHAAKTGDLKLEPTRLDFHNEVDTAAGSPELKKSQSGHGYAAAKGEPSTVPKSVSFFDEQMCDV